MSEAADRFTAFFRATHGHAPFPWQTRFLELVLEEGWQRPLSLPTSSGKTAVLDIAVFALALQADMPATRRMTPRRICLVVDRRIVVDDAHARARRIVEALKSPTDPVVEWVAQRLALLGGENPLDVALLRGGIYREERWARTPLQPVLLCSTVDQVGSRLLHRGYGLSPRAWPIHAGLLGHDTLFVLDEAHCSQPFLQTLEAVSHLRQQAEEPLPGPWAAIAMTATPRPGLVPFALAAEDHQHAVLAQRLNAHKPATLRRASKKGDVGVAEEALRVLRDDCAARLAPGSSTLVVLNRVRAARALYEMLAKLQQSGTNKLECDLLLLTGRSRPVERDAALAHFRERIAAGRRRGTDGRPLIVVATQCIEVGADLDVDTLVTETAPLDSLRQRFGRLDRLGELGQSRAFILCRPELAGDAGGRVLPKDPDPVYGPALTKTWWWLEENADQQGCIDFGIHAMSQRLASSGNLAELSSSAPAAPFVFPVYCDLWAQTGPEPALSPDPAMFLHGPRSGPAEVGIVWRADLDPEQPDSWADVVAACPPTAGEVLPLPLHAARAWLAGTAADPGIDVEGRFASEQEEAQAIRAPRVALHWRGAEASTVVAAEGVTPGATLVVPCAWGGCDRMGWTGLDSAPTQDLMDEARIAANRPALLRVHPSLALTEEPAAQPASWTEQAKRDASCPEGLPPRQELLAEFRPLLVSWSERADRPARARVLQGLVEDGAAIRIQPHPSGVGFIVSGKHRLAEAARDFSDEDELSSLASDGVVALSGHLDDVRRHAEHFARGVGLNEGLVEALARAGHLHDLGKADPRFQAWLVGGDWTLVDAQAPLAKSDRLRTGRASESARRLAGYPQGGRHELLSVRLAESAPDLLPEDPVLRDLVLHLVASHHGHCRPWAPVVVDPRPLHIRYLHEGVETEASTATALERLDSGVADRFWRLLRRYGWWGLSYLEACARLADHRASERPGTPLFEDAA